MTENEINKALKRMERRAEIASRHLAEDADSEKIEGWKSAWNDYRCTAEALVEIKMYRAIGMIEECREAMEKQIPKEAIRKTQEEDLEIGSVTFKAGTKTYWCPVCEKAITRTDHYCRHCGQAIDWRSGSD